MLSSPLHLKHNADVHNFELSGNNAMHLVMLKFDKHWTNLPIGESNWVLGTG